MNREFHEAQFRRLFQPRSAFTRPEPKLVLLHLDLELASKIWLIEGKSQTPGQCFIQIKKMVNEYVTNYMKGEAELSIDHEVCIHVQNNQIARFYIDVPGTERPRVRLSDTSNTN